MFVIPTTNYKTLSAGISNFIKNTTYYFSLKTLLSNSKKKKQ